MKTRIMACIIPLALLGPAAYAAPQAGASDRDGVAEAAGEEINVAVGESKVLIVRNVKEYLDGAPGVVETKNPPSDPSRFVVVGRKPGTTTLLLIRNDGTQQTYTINVFTRSPVAVERELKQLLDGLPTVNVRRVGARFILGGYVADEGERSRVDHIASLFPGQVETMVGVGASLGGAGSDGGGKRFMIRIDFYFVELDSRSQYAFGVGWPKSIGGGSATFNYDFLQRTGTATATVTQPLPQLDVAADHGWGKILKHATVVTNSGAEAKFQSGGEQNFTTNTGLSVGLQSVSYGLDIGVIPRFDPTRRDVELRVNANQSDLTAPGAGSAPGRTTSKLTTNVNVKLGQSIVLSGIRTKTQTHDVGGIPILSSIPVLGVLFGSHNDTQQEMDAAIYIVPNVIEAVPNASVELVEGAVQRFKDYGGNIKDAHLYDERPSSR